MVASLLVNFCIAAQLSSVCGSSRDEEAIDRFRSYLRIDTVHPDPDYRPAVDFLVAQAHAIGGLETKILEFVKGKPVVLFTWRGADDSLPSILLNSHVDVVPAEVDKWEHPPFSAALTQQGNIYARGSQDMKCVGLQYLEAVRNLKRRGFKPLRSVHLSFVPDEEIGGHDGVEKLVASTEFKDLNVGFVLDEGLASPDQNYRVFNGERSPWWLVIKAVGEPGHGSKLYDNSAMENLLKSLELISRYRAGQFDLVKNGKAAEGDVVSVNLVFLKSGRPTPTVSSNHFCIVFGAFKPLIFVLCCSYSNHGHAGFCNELTTIRGRSRVGHKSITSCRLRGAREAHF